MRRFFYYVLFGIPVFRDEFCFLMISRITTDGYNQANGRIFECALTIDFTKEPSFSSVFLGESCLKLVLFSPSICINLFKSFSSASLKNLNVGGGEDFTLFIPSSLDSNRGFNGGEAIGDKNGVSKVSRMSPKLLVLDPFLLLSDSKSSLISNKKCKKRDYEGYNWKWINVGFQCLLFLGRPSSSTIEDNKALQKEKFEGPNTPGRKPNKQKFLNRIKQRVFSHKARLMSNIISKPSNQPQSCIHHRFNDQLPIRAHTSLLHPLEHIPRTKKHPRHMMQPPKNQLPKSSGNLTITKN
ncbi:hypothetical protein LXL04_017772 [Taraxacum kok-saghyz]